MCPTHNTINVYIIATGLKNSKGIEVEVRPKVACSPPRLRGGSTLPEMILVAPKFPPVIKVKSYASRLHVSNTKYNKLMHN